MTVFYFYSENSNKIYSLQVTDFNGKSTCLGQFYVYKLGNHIHCMFTHLHFIYDRHFIFIVMMKYNTLIHSGGGNTNNFSKDFDMKRL